MIYTPSTNHNHYEISRRSQALRATGRHCHAWTFCSSKATRASVIFRSSWLMVCAGTGWIIVNHNHIQVWIIYILYYIYINYIYVYIPTVYKLLIIQYHRYTTSNQHHWELDITPHPATQSGAPPSPLLRPTLRSWSRSFRPRSHKRMLACHEASEARPAAGRCQVRGWKMLESPGSLPQSNWSFIAGKTWKNHL